MESMKRTTGDYLSLHCILQLFGYGDDANPYTETVDTLEDLVLEFITDMTQRAMDIGRSGRVQVN